MKSFRPAFVLALALLLVPVVARAQSLGEIAAKERQRRESQKTPPTKVLTEVDLENAQGGSASVAVGDPSAAPKPAGDAEGAKKEGVEKDKKAGDKSEDELKAERQTAWRKKLTDAEARLKKLQEAQAVYQNDLNDPNLGVYSQGRQSIQGFLEEAKADATKVQAEIDALLAEGRANAFQR